ncbi:lysylphosphatidylglycerol synthase transmembrane domain-containing protein [Planctomycetes bacterium Pan216]|uniref:lysylphosphatidylglycerol synthase transmembrane domain-containing protein n=1 Tax=Kolteria novifilia TaxID=2527975 RepID=UPI0011A1B02F
MTEKNSKPRRLLWNVVRAAVTVGAVAYVVSQITWRDRLRLPDGEVVWGWKVDGPDGTPVFKASDGQDYPIPKEMHDTDPNAPYIAGFITLWRGVNLWGLIGVILLYPMVIFLTARRWQWLLQTHQLDPGYWEAVRLTWMGILTNNVFPGSTGGDLVKGWCIYRRSPGKQVPAVMTVLMDRVLGLISLLIVGAVTVLLVSDRPELRVPSMFVWFGLLGVFVGGIVYFSGRLRRLLRVSDIVNRLPFNDKIRKLDHSVFHYRDHVPVLSKAIGISLIVHIWAILCVYGVGLSLGLAVPVFYYFIFLPVILTVGAVVPAIGGLGVLEVQFQEFFSLEGVGATPSSALALCILYRLMLLVASLPGAVPTFKELSYGSVPRNLTEENGAGSEPIVNYKAAC